MILKKDKSSFYRKFIDKVKRGLSDSENGIIYSKTETKKLVKYLNTNS